MIIDAPRDEKVTGRTRTALPVHAGKAGGSGRIAAMSQALTILCTCPDEASATRLAHGLVAERLAACVNILGPIRSIYRWRDSVEDEMEYLVVIKTGPDGFDVVERWLCEQHPYDVPEVLALPAERVSGPYLEWLEASVSIERES